MEEEAFQAGAPLRAGLDLISVRVVRAGVDRFRTYFEMKPVEGLLLDWMVGEKKIN